MDTSHTPETTTTDTSIKSTEPNATNDEPSSPITTPNNMFLIGNVTHTTE